MTHHPLPPLIDFVWQQGSLYSCHGESIPRVGDFVTLDTIEHPVHGHQEGDTHWRVHAVEWAFRWQGGIGEIRPEITVHLRRLHPHEWANRHEPTGYRYEKEAVVSETPP